VAACHLTQIPPPQDRDTLRRLGIVIGVHSVRVLERLWPLVGEHFTADEDGYLIPRESLWYRRPAMEVTPLLEQLIERWGSACVYCKRDRVRLQIEHIIPSSRGGSSDISNLALACGPCNSKKSNKTASEFGHPHIEDMARSFADA
jgi:5-methylcytosine-specific restriction endonuclease McrA